MLSLEELIIYFPCFSKQGCIFLSCIFVELNLISKAYLYLSATEREVVQERTLESDALVQRTRNELTNMKQDLLPPIPGIIEESYLQSPTQQGANQALARRKKRINQNGEREERRKRDFRACKQQATTAEKPLHASLQFKGIVRVPLSKTYTSI